MSQQFLYCKVHIPLPKVNEIIEIWYGMVPLSFLFADWRGKGITSFSGGDYWI